MRWLAGLVVALLVVLGGCAQAPTADTSPTPIRDQPTSDQPTGTATPVGTTSTDGANHPADPDADILGWENGLWFNESIVVDQSDGLNDSEMDLVVGRAMARVEQIRGLEFQKTVPVEIVTRDKFRADQENRSIADDRRRFDNVKFEALFMINETTDSIDLQNQNSGTAIGGYYSPSEERIVVVSENVSSPKLDEITLSQELFHALQDQQFNLSSFDQSTRERHNAVDGIIEGDGNYVDYLYEQHCRNEWDGDCLFPQPTEGGGSSGGLANIGTYILKFQPYSDGPPFVKQLHEEQGWDAVNAIYENPPASTEQVIHPEKYPEDEPTELTVEDRSSGDWSRLELEDRPSFGELGEAGLTAMFVYPMYETGGRVALIPPNEFLNYDDSGNLDQIDPLNYDNKYANGWDGDRFVVYTTEDGETGYVWKFAWDSEADATEFLEGYRKLLEYRNASEVDGHENTWLISGKDSYSGAYYLQQEGDTVVIVRAPSVDDLSGVHEGSAPSS